MLLFVIIYNKLWYFVTTFVTKEIAPTKEERGSKLDPSLLNMGPSVFWMFCVPGCRCLRYPCLIFFNRKVFTIIYVTVCLVKFFFNRKVFSIILVSISTISASCSGNAGYFYQHNHFAHFRLSSVAPVSYYDSPTEKSTFKECQCLHEFMNMTFNHLKGKEKSQANENEIN